MNRTRRWQIGLIAVTSFIVSCSHQSEMAGDEPSETTNVAGLSSESVSESAPNNSADTQALAVPDAASVDTQVATSDAPAASTPMKKRRARKPASTQNSAMTAQPEAVAQPAAPVAEPVAPEAAAPVQQPVAQAPVEANPSVAPFFMQYWWLALGMGAIFLFFIWRKKRNEKDYVKH